MEGSETIFDRVRASARFVRDNAHDVKINHDAVAAFVKTLDPVTKMLTVVRTAAEFESKAASRGYPLRFATLEEEVGFWGLLALLNFGSGFRVPLHQARNRGAFETIQRGLMGMYISGSTIDTQFLKEISLVQVGELFDIPLFEERDVYGGAIFMSAPGPLHPLGTMLQEVLNETGRTLEKEGCSKGLGEWVVRVVKGIPEGPHVAAQFVEKLVTTLPGFTDKATYKDKEVFILKKAQLLAADLYRHMRAKEPRFDFADIHDVTVFADNVLPAVLRKLGVLELSESLSAKVDSNEDLPRGDGEVELRCVAIAACDEIVETWKRERQAASEGVELNSMKLDFYLWAKGKEEGFRSIARHATKDTFYY